MAAPLLWQSKLRNCAIYWRSFLTGCRRRLVREEPWCRVGRDSAPGLLAGQEGSRYRAMLEAEETIRKGLWSSDGWRSLSLRDGLVVE